MYMVFQRNYRSVISQACMNQRSVECDITLMYLLWNQDTAGTSPVGLQKLLHSHGPSLQDEGCF